MRFLFAILLCLPAATAAGEVSFCKEIAPILVRKCLGCHNNRKTEGRYALHTFEMLLKAGESGEPPLVVGEPDESYLFAKLTETDAELRMPLEDEPLSSDEVKLFRQWIAQGGSFDGPKTSDRLVTLLPPRNHPPSPKTYRTAVPVFAIKFSPNGKRLLTGGWREILVWNAASGELVQRIGGLPQRIHCMEYSRDGRTLAIGGGAPGEYGEIRLVDLAGSAPDGSPPANKVLAVWEDVVLDLRFSADGRTLVAGGADNTVRAYNMSDQTELWKKAQHVDWVTAVDVTDYRFAEQRVSNESLSALFTPNELDKKGRSHIQQQWRFPEGGFIVRKANWEFESLAPVQDGAPDSGAPDSGAPDSGAPDSGAPDSGAPDSGAPDSGAPDSGAPDSGAPDSGAPDSGAPDSGAPESGAPESGAPDSGAPDSGAPDSGAPDSGAPDSGAPDSGAPDSGAPDSGAPDSGAPDSGAPDSGAPDSGAPDSGAPDSGAPDSGAPDSGAPDSGAPDSGGRTGNVLTKITETGIGKTYKVQRQSFRDASLNDYAAVIDALTQLHESWPERNSGTEFVVSSSQDRTVKVFRRSDGELFTTYKGHRREYGPLAGMHRVFGVQAERRTRRIWSGGEGNHFHGWNPVTVRDEDGTAADMEARFAKEYSMDLIRHDFVNAVFTMKQTGPRLFAAGADGQLKRFALAGNEARFDLKQVATRQTYSGLTDHLFAIDTSPDGSLVASSGFSGEVIVWRVNTGEVITRFTAAPKAHSP